MKLRHVTIALALLVPATASAGPLQPTAALSDETAFLYEYDAPNTASPLAIQSFAPVTSSHYVYETSFTVSLSSYTPTDTQRPREDQPQPVPEPSTLLLVGSSLAFAAVRKARAARKQQDVQ